MKKLTTTFQVNEYNRLSLDKNKLGQPPASGIKQRIFNILLHPLTNNH